MKIYMSGCISNKDRKVELQNIALFFKAEERLRKRFPHAEIHNPARYCHKGWEWNDYLAYDLRHIHDQKPMLVMLKNWESSKGATLERTYALQMGLLVVEEGVLI